MLVLEAPLRQAMMNVNVINAVDYVKFINGNTSVLRTVVKPVIRGTVGTVAMLIHRKHGSDRRTLVVQSKWRNAVTNVNNASIVVKPPKKTAPQIFTTGNQ